MEGSQTPRLRVSPKRVETSGVDAAFLASSYGLTPDPWQQLVLDDWLGEDKKGRLTAGSVALAVPRQNGKNAILEIVELFKMVMQGRKILHTAHEVKTTRKAFLRLAGFFENERHYPELAELVAANGIRRTNGQEAIYLTNGGSVEFVARTRGSGRGFTVDDLVCDEVQELTDEQLEALLPTIASAPSGDPQQLYTGTPPTPRSVGEVFPRMRSLALSGKARRMCWHEWSIPDESTPEAALRAWKENAYSTNPALGHRLNIQTVTDERAAMSPEGFCRERFGWWESLKVGRKAIDQAAWRAAKVSAESVPDDGVKSFAVKFSPDGARVALSVALKPTEGPVHVEGIRVANMGEGTDWLVDFLAERHKEAAQIVVDGKFGTGFLVNALRDAGVKNKKQVLMPTFDQVKSAHSMFLQAVQSGGVSMIEQDELDAEARDAEFRELGKDGGFGWSAPEGGSVLLLETVTFAFWAAKTTRRRPSKQSVVEVF